MSKKYKKSLSKQLFRNAARTLEEKRTRPPREGLIGWNETLEEYNLRIYRERREALLSECVPEKKCPICGKLRLRSAQWVFITQKHLDRFKDLPKHFELLRKHLDRVICRACITTWNYERRRVERKNMGRRKENVV